MISIVRQPEHGAADGRRDTSGIDQGLESLRQIKRQPDYDTFIAPELARMHEDRAG